MSDRLITRSSIRRRLAAASGAACWHLPGLREARRCNRPPPRRAYAHVLLISIDGMHAIDLARFIGRASGFGPRRAGAAGRRLQQCRRREAERFLSRPACHVTGGSPASTGVYYDDSYDRTLSAPGSNCAVKGSGDRLRRIHRHRSRQGRRSGGIDPKKLPLDPAHGCKPVYPHSFLRVNTIFEVVKAAGMRTAWSDKHPAYDLVNGPSGKGVDDLYTPEIAAGGADGDAAKAEAYDDCKVAALLNEIDGKDHGGDKTVGVPALFGMNFQAVSVTAEGRPAAAIATARAMPSDVLGRGASTIPTAPSASSSPS